jgi:hypothetical protein
MAILAVLAGLPCHCQAQAPEQMHLAFAAPGSMTISWITRTVQPTHPEVMYRRVDSPANTYSHASADSREVGDGSRAHHAIMKGLAVATEVVYMVGDAATGNYSAKATFLYNLSPGSSAAFTVGIIGDMGIAPYGNGTAARLIQHADEFDWIMHVGDLAYADDRPDSKNPKRYNSYFNQFSNDVEPVSSKMAYMVCPGNHEVFCHSEGVLAGPCPNELKNFTSFNARYRMPGRDSNSSNDNMWYSFDYGKAHFISIDTETDYPDAPETKWEFDHAGGFGDQISWLKADLQAAVGRRKDVPWIIVYGHRPMYSSQKQGIDKLIWNNATGILRRAIEDLLYDAHADLYISGHVHAYERFLPMYRSEATDRTYDSPRGITSVIVGHAGNIEGHACSWEKLPEYEAVRTCEGFGYSRMTVNSTHLEFNMYFSDSDQLEDRFTITKTN